MHQNRATLIGFLGKDAKVKSTRNNATIAVLSLMRSLTVALYAHVSTEDQNVKQQLDKLRK